MMELMYSRAIPGPEFVSLSILLRSDISGSDASQISCHLGGGGEPFIVSAPLSTISQSSCKEALTELHLYINTILKLSGSNSKETATTGRFLQEDERFLFDNTNANATNNDFETRIFRPQKCHGLALQYHVIQDRKQISSFLVPLILNYSKVTAGMAVGIDTKDVTGVVFCVGMGGGPNAVFGLGTTSLTYSLSHRMKKSLGILCNETTTTSISNNKKGSNVARPTAMNLTLAQSLLTTLLLTDDEDRIVNSMINGEHQIDISQEDQFTKRVLTLGSKKKNSHLGMGSGSNNDQNPLHTNSADQARAIVERMAVLSVCSTDSILRKYENRQAAKEAAGKSGKKRLRKLAKDADLDGFDFRGEKRSSSLSNINVSRHNVANNGSVSAASVAVGGDDVSVSAGSTFTSASNLTLKGPKKDTATKSTASRSRLPSPGVLGSNNRDRSRLQGLLASNGKDAFAQNRRMSADPTTGRAPHAPQRRANSMIEAHSSSFDGGHSFGSSQGGRQQFDPFFDPQGQSNDAFGQNLSTDSASDGIKALVNVALNEDLTCFYKLSKISSCSVEGVVQVQMRSNVDSTVPFNLLIKDPSNYIQNIQENKMYAKGVVDKSKKTDFAFAVTVPKAEEYFPVMRYKCGEDLRPVPIRVQTRVRLEESHWRVALQISANPHNDGSLTDLTIIMGVPPEVNGESLTTSPPGGVWNASKRSVIWCVSELGGGEKFQLQARFEIDPNSPTEYDDEDKPKFPILVRCQCMHAQLSNIEIDVGPVPHGNADVKMKMARRFRLSHRERP